jgi:hypothetical protein
VKKILVRIANVILISSAIVLMAVNVCTIYLLNYKVGYLAEEVRMYGTRLQNFNIEIIKSVERDSVLAAGIVELFKENKIITGNLVDYVDLQPTRLQQEVSKIEENLIKSTYMIINYTGQAQGSGVLIRYNDKYYILSAGHMVTDDGEDINTPDDIAIFEEGILISKLTIKKLDKSVDLVLFSIDNINKLNITNYAIIANEEPLKAESIYIVGNPVGIEDLLSEGKIINYTDDYVYFYDHSFFGSSGGGIFNLKGELIGTISHLKATINIGLPFVIHGATRQSKIMEFLKDVR